MESEQGDYLLAPAYDLMCTAIHIDDSGLALHNGLYTGDREEASYNSFGTYTRQSFLAFAQKATIPMALATPIIDEYLLLTPKAIEMIDRSFLSQKAKKRYLEIIGDRHRKLNLK
jgi:serine/threonine-protein kinase HipA